jgi:hypothetical protein
MNPRSWWRVHEPVSLDFPDKERLKHPRSSTPRRTMQRLTKKVRAATLVLAAAAGAALAAPSPANAQAQPTIEGVWRVTRHGVICQTGQEVVTFPAIMTFARGGTITGDAVAPGGTPAQGTSEHGLWRREPGDQNYSLRLLGYAWDPATGAFQGSTEVTAKLQMTDNDTFTYESVIQFFDPQGNPAGPAHCGRATGTRFQ